MRTSHEFNHEFNSECTSRHVNTYAIKSYIDLRKIVAQDLGQPPIHSGRAALYKCPFHQEQKGYSLAVWPDGYRCFGKCDMAGDVFDWLMTYRQLSFTQALHALGEGPLPGEQNATHRALRIASTEPPPQAWQTAAEEVVVMAEDWLWSDVGERALAYLVERGLSTRTIRAARLGYIPGDSHAWRHLAGLNVPCGITIPWHANDALWAVKVRRAVDSPKYVQIAGGSSHGLYNADMLARHQIALFCEGEFDALLVQQEAGSLVSPVTLGSAAARLTTRWLAHLVQHPTILVSYDNDEAGQRAAEHLLRVSTRFKALPLPSGKDILPSEIARLRSMLQ